MKSACFVILSFLFSFHANAGSAPAQMKPFMPNPNRLKKVKLVASLEGLPESEKKALDKIIEASRHLDPVYLKQVWKGNPELEKKLKADTSTQGKKRLALFEQNKGPWSRLDEDKAFLPGVPVPKPAGAGFYPEDMTQAEFESWLKSLFEKERELATGFFSVIHRDKKGKLLAVPYSQAYEEHLKPAAKLLKEASQLTQDKSLRKYLELRSEAFLTDQYYKSDVAWMELDSLIEPTIGPYETYEDGLFNYKAAFESFVGIRDEKETQSLEKFSAYLQDIENHLPIPEVHRNKKIGALAPIRVVQQVFTSGEARRGIATAAFNLPNDEKVIKEKGSKRVMLKNVQEAKFEHILKPIAKVALPSQDQKDVAFEPFFTHILMHEMVHGLGPHEIQISGKSTSVRKELKDLYSALEEAKADITGLFAMEYLLSKGVVDKSMAKSMYTTFLASCFRSVRFGIHEAHGKGIALQFNYLREQGAIEILKNGRFRINFSKIKKAVTDLASAILMIQVSGSYSDAKKFLDRYAIIKPEMKNILDKLSSIPIDIQPYYPLAGEKS